jgi:hypothetical protein
MPRNSANGKVSVEGAQFSYKEVGEKSYGKYALLYNEIFKKSHQTVKCEPTTKIFFIRKDDEKKDIGVLQLTKQVGRMDLDYIGFKDAKNCIKLKREFIKSLSSRYDLSNTPL